MKLGNGDASSCSAPYGARKRSRAFGTVSRHGHFLEMRAGTNVLGRSEEDESDLSPAIITLGQGLAVDRSDLVRRDVTPGVVNAVDSRLRDLVTGPEQFGGVARHPSAMFP
jgi:hypothetical protein